MNSNCIGAETWELRKINKKYSERSDVWQWKRIEKIIWTDLVKREEVWNTRKVKEERRILNKINRRRTNWISYIFLRNCLLKQGNEGKETWRRGRRRRQSLDYLKRKYCKLKEEGRDRTFLESSLWNCLWTRCKTDYITMTCTGPRRLPSTQPLISLIPLFHAT